MMRTAALVAVAVRSRARDDDEELEDERFRIGIGRRGPRHEPEQPLALARAG